MKPVTQISTSTSTAEAAGVPDPWQRPIREFAGLVHLAPPVAHLDDPLATVIDAFSRDRGAGAMFVVDDDDKLLGSIPERAIDSDLATLVLPQRLWPAVHEMDTRAILRAARGAERRARDLMVRVRSVTPETPLIEAVGLMIRSGDPTLPLLDESG